jgi:hypothetical protein
MKKLILSSVFAGLVLAGSAVKAEVAPKKAPYGKFVINADIAAGYWANVYHSVPNPVTGAEREDTIDANDWKKRQLIALSDSKVTFKTEGGCSAVAFGSVLKIDANSATLAGSNEKGQHAGIFRDMYVFGRFADMVEVRIGSQRDAMYSLVDGADVMGGTFGYNGYWGSMLAKSVDASGATRKERWVLDLTHANDTWYTNKLDIRTTRMAGVQAVATWQPSSAFNGRMGTYGDGNKVTEAGVTNNQVSLGMNYDNTFGDIRVRASLGGVYGISDIWTGDMDNDGNHVLQNTSLTYRLGGIFSWKTFDIGLGWLDNRTTGYENTDAEKNKNAGKVLHGAVGYQFDTVTWTPRVSVGAMWGWKNGKNDSSADNEFKNQNQTLVFSGAVDLNIRDGFRWFLEGTFAMLDESNKTEPGIKDNGYSQRNVIIGTGLAVSQ